MLNELNSTGFAGITHQLGTILVVEDDGLLAMMLEDLVRDAGAAGVIVSHDSEHALQAATDEPLECAILDISVWGSSTTNVADVLAERGIPFMFCSGFTANDLEQRHRHRPLLAKPYSDAEFKAALATTLGR